MHRFDITFLHKTLIRCLTLVCVVCVVYTAFCLFMNAYPGYVRYQQVDVISTKMTIKSPFLTRDNVASVTIDQRPAVVNFILEPEITSLIDGQFVLIVQSQPTNFDRRSMIRNTWGKSSHYANISRGEALRPRIFFTVGIAPGLWQDMKKSEMLVRESSHFKDILLIDMMDNNLTLKSLLTMAWINTRLPQAQFILKTNDDILLNTFIWIRIVQAMKSREMNCFVICGVWRSDSNSVSYAQYGAESYPSFCSGSAYLMSHDTMHAILESSAHVPLLPREDTYITGIMTDAANVTMYALMDNLFLITNNWNVTNITEITLVVHDPNYQLWMLAWDMFLKGNRLNYQHVATKHKITELDLIHKKFSKENRVPVWYFASVEQQSKTCSRRTKSVPSSLKVTLI